MSQTLPQIDWRLILYFLLTIFTYPGNLQGRFKCEKKFLIIPFFPVSRLHEIIIVVVINSEMAETSLLSTEIIHY